MSKTPLKWPLLCREVTLDTKHWLHACANSYRQRQCVCLCVFAAYSVYPRMSHRRRHFAGDLRVHQGVAGHVTTGFAVASRLSWQRQVLACSLPRFWRPKWQWCHKNVVILWRKWFPLRSYFSWQPHPLCAFFDITKSDLNRLKTPLILYKLSQKLFHTLIYTKFL